MKNGVVTVDGVEILGLGVVSKSGEAWNINHQNQNVNCSPEPIYFD